MISPNRVGGDRSRAVKAAFALSLLLSTVACVASFDRPPSFDQGPLRERALTKTKDGIRVSAMIPSADESKTIFGVDLRPEGIQPFWLEIENGADHPFVFLPTGLDPEYFSPLEVAFLYNGSLSEEANTTLAEHIESVSFDRRRIIYPGDTISGFVYLNLSDPTMVAEIDLIGRKWSQRMSFLVPVPGMQKGRRVLTAIRQLYTAADLVEINDETELRRALEGLPCCATSENGIGRGLPLNLILIGEIEEWAPAFVRQMYRHSTASPWYAFGRVQDFAAHKFSRWVAPQPHALRFWLTHLRYQGQPIWLAQVSTALGGRFAASAELTRGIEPRVDEARNDIVQDLLYSQAMAKIGFVKGVGPVAPAEPSRASDGRTYHTDGLRAVMVFGDKPVSLDKIDFFEWERLVDHYRQEND